MIDDRLSCSDNAPVMMKTPIRERVQKLTNRYNGAKTPEQFMRALQRAKSPNLTANMAKSPLKVIDNKGLEEKLTFLEAKKRSVFTTNAGIFENRLIPMNLQYNTSLNSSRVSVDHMISKNDGPRLAQEATCNTSR